MEPASECASAAAKSSRGKAPVTMMEVPPVPTLSAAQIHEFKERGVLVIPDALDPATCAACRQRRLC